MENTTNIIEKLMANRATLMMARFDKELKEIIEKDLQILKSQQIQQLGNRSRIRKAA